MASQTHKLSNQCVKTQLYRATGAVYTSTQVYPVNVYLTKGKSSTDTGFFKPGIYRVNPYEVYREVVESDSTNITCQYDKYGSDWTFAWSGDVLASGMSSLRKLDVPSTMTSLGQQALQKAYAKIQSSDLSLGEDLGELRETLEMLKNPFASLRKFLHKDGHRNLNEIKDLINFRYTRTYGGFTGRKAAKAAADSWMEVRYGFRPLVMLIGDLVEQAKKKDLGSFDPEKIRSVRASASDTDEYSLSNTTVPILNGSVICSRRYRDELTAYAAVQYRQSRPVTTMMNLGLTPRFWPEIAWELTRLSFVWDWLLTIGPWIGSLRYKPEITLLGNTVGHKLVRTGYLQGLTVHTGYEATGEADRGYPAKGRYQYLYYKRLVGQSLPSTPLLRVGDVMDLFKTIDSLALIIQRVFR